jgi:hypothetical protein
LARLKAGDYLVAWLAPMVKAFGSYANEHTGIAHALPSRPLVDELRRLPPATANDLAAALVGLPQLRFLPE